MTPDEKYDWKLAIVVMLIFAFAIWLMFKGDLFTDIDNAQFQPTENQVEYYNIDPAVIKRAGGNLMIAARMVWPNLYRELIPYTTSSGRTILYRIIYPQRRGKK